MSIARVADTKVLRVVAKDAMLASMPNNAITPMGTPEACAALGVSKDTLIRMIAAGKITKATKLPGQNGAWVLDRDEIEAMASAKAAAS